MNRNKILPVFVAVLLGPLFLFVWVQAVSSAQAADLDRETSPAWSESTSDLNACPADMIAYWQLNETITGTYTDSFDGHDAACVGDACPTPASGKVSGGQQFDGANDAVDAPASADFDWGPADDFSIEVWMQWSGTMTMTDNVVFVGRDDASTDLHWWIGINHLTDTADFYLASTLGEDDKLDGITDLTDGSWHHVVAVRDGTNGKILLYVDGVKEAEKDKTYTGGFDSASSALNIGWLNLGHGYYFDGVLDEIAVYGRALSESEIQDHYYDGIGQSYCSDPPTAENDEFTVEEDSVGNLLDVLANDSTPDNGEILSIVAAGEVSGGGIITPTSTEILYTPASNFYGAETFTYTITDGYPGSYATALVTVTVTPVNDPPELTNPGDQTSTTGVTVTLPIDSSDIDGDDVTFEAAGLPPDLMIDPATGVISGTISTEISEVVTYTVVVTGTDIGVPPESDSIEFNWKVIPGNLLPPEISDPGPQVNLEGDIVSMEVSAADPEGDPLTFSAVNLPPGLSITTTGTTTGTISGQIDFDTVGEYAVVLTASDGDLSDSVTFTWSVRDVLFLPLVTYAGSGS